MSQVTVETCQTRAEAQIIARMLSDAGLEAAVVGDDAGGALPHLTTGAGGFSVRVPADQEATAAGLLDVDLRPSDDEPQDGSDDGPHPARQRHLRLAMAVALVVIVVGILISVIG